MNGVIYLFVYLGVAFAAFYPFVIHVVTCVKDSSWVLLTFGLVFFPIGWLHGVFVSLFG